MKITKKVELFEDPLYTKVRFFSKTIHLKEEEKHFHCNQCIKTLHLGYQSPIYDDFHMLHFNRGSFFHTPGKHTHI